MGLPARCLWLGDPATRGSEKSPTGQRCSASLSTPHPLPSPLSHDPTSFFMATMSHNGSDPSVRGPGFHDSHSQRPTDCLAKRSAYYFPSNSQSQYGGDSHRERADHTMEKEGNNRYKFDTCLLMQTVLPARLVGDGCFGASVFPSVKSTGSRRSTFSRVDINKTDL